MLSRTSLSRAVVAALSKYILFIYTLNRFSWLKNVRGIKGLLNTVNMNFSVTLKSFIG